MKYTNHSGGAQGADTEWEIGGLKYGVVTVPYSFPGHNSRSSNRRNLTIAELNEGASHAKLASDKLGRPWKYIEAKLYVKNLISRNWFQVKNSECIYAVGQLVSGSDKLVDGGTGWAVQMAVDNQKSIYLFEQNFNSWFTYDYETNKFIVIDHVPTLTENFAGIGTREINENGKKAITEVYKTTFST